MRRIIPLLLAMLFCFVGCVETVDSFTIFSMEGFDPFFDFYTSQEKKNAYLESGGLEFARLGDVYVCPFIKETSHEECGLFFYIYSIENDSIESITISNINLIIQESGGSIYKSNSDQSVLLEAPDDNYLQGTIKCYFESSEEWLYKGNILKISFQATANGNTQESEEFSYDIKISFVKRPLMPT